MKANGDKLNMAHAGVGSIFFTTCLMLNATMGVKPTLVPFNGGAPAMNALVGGQVDYMCGDVVTAAPQLTGGTIKAYAIASPERNPVLPNLPTTAEAGLPDYQASAWFALFAPKATPTIVARLVDALDKALDDETTRKRMLVLGSVIPARRSYPCFVGNPGEERNRQVDAGAQGGQLIHKIKVMVEGRDAGSAPCRLRGG